MLQLAWPAGVLTKIKRQTGFPEEAVFRKFLWFLLRERKFDQSAVDDMVLLKSALSLTADQASTLFTPLLSRSRSSMPELYLPAGPDCLKWLKGGKTRRPPGRPPSRLES